LWQDYRDRGVQVLVIDVKESREDTETYVKRSKFTFPVLMDSDGSVAAQYAPSSVLPDLPRSDVVIASNLIIDADGIIRFMSLLDTTSFDAKLVALKARLDKMLAAD
jgi:peroxiredoxin